MLFVLHGENALRRAEALADAVKQSGISPDMREFNTEILTPPVQAGDIRRTCSTMPFLGGVRIVIVKNALSKDKGTLSKEIAAYLPDLPPTTYLIFDEAKKLGARNAVLKFAQKHDAHIVHCALPSAKALPRWIQQRTQQHGGKIEPRAASVLAQNIGPNLLLMDQEIQKLRLYCGDQKTITLADVQVMVPYVQSADVIFSLVDAIGQRNPRTAARHLHRLLDVGEHPLGIFGMVVRQFRLLIQIRWLVDQRVNETEIAKRLKLHPYVTQKVRRQATHFTPRQLRQAYQLLTDSDLAIKTGQLPPDIALDLLITELTSL